MNHPVPVPVSVWLVCKLCRGSFQHVTAFLAHKTEKHFDEFKNVKSIIFEERIFKDNVDIDSNFLVASHNLELSTQDEKAIVDVVFNIDSSRQIEPEKSMEEQCDRHVYTCKFTNANQENAVDFTIENECVTINISRSSPILGESELEEQAKSEAVNDEFIYDDKIKILQSGQRFHQPEENSEKLFLAALSGSQKQICQHVDVENEEIFGKDTLTSNEAFLVEIPEVNSVNFGSAEHHTASPLLKINSGPANVDALNFVPEEDEIIDVTNINKLKTSSFEAVQITSPAPSPKIDLAPQNFTTVTIPPDLDLSLTRLVHVTNRAVNYDAPLVSEAEIDSYTEQQHDEKTVICSNFYCEPKFNLKSLKNPYVLLERLPLEDLTITSVTKILNQRDQCQNPVTGSVTEHSSQAKSHIESDTDPTDFDPSDDDSDSNFKPKYFKSKIKQMSSHKKRAITNRNLVVKKPLVCAVCNLTFRYRHQLNDHKWKIHSIKPVSCTYPNCNKTVTDRHSLKIHLKRHENPSNDICYVFPLHLDENKADPGGPKEILPLKEWLKNQPITDNVIILEPDPLIAENLENVSLTSPISCKLCSKSLTSETEVKIHVKNCWTHNTKLHRFCVQCKKTFEKPYKLKVHNMKVHLTQAEKDVHYPFTCDHCSKNFIFHYQLKYHQETHKRREERMNVVDCHICGKPGIHKSYLEDHLRTHSAEKLFKCPHPDCAKACKSKFTLRDHLKRVHCDSRPFQCPHCSYSAKNKAVLNHHSFVHKTELQKPLQYFRCAHDNCDKQYLARKTLKYHMKKYHNGGVISDLKTFLCKICKKTFATAVTLRTHRLVHTENREFKCTFAGCRADFKLKFKLVEHEREHSGLKPFVCETCGKSYSKICSFHKHRKSHENLLNQHLCSHCPRKFPGSWELKQHLLVHKKGAQFVCQFCGKKCTKKENLKIHEQSHDKPKKRNQREQRGAKKRGRPKKITDHYSSSSSESEGCE